jgi:hypothetical protein
MVQEVFAGDRIAVGARGSSGASSSKGAADFRFTLGSGLPGMILQHKSCQFPAVNNRKPELTQKAFLAESDLPGRPFGHLSHYCPGEPVSACGEPCRGASMEHA